MKSMKGDIGEIKMGERIQIPLKAGHHRPASETPSNGVSQTARYWPNIGCWLGSFLIYRGSGPVLLSNPIDCAFSRGGVQTPCPLSESAHGKEDDMMSVQQVR